jgi:hypothetical protein
MGVVVLINNNLKKKIKKKKKKKTPSLHYTTFHWLHGNSTPKIPKNTLPIA